MQTFNYNIACPIIFYSCQFTGKRLRNDCPLKLLKCSLFESALIRPSRIDRWSDSGTLIQYMYVIDPIGALRGDGVPVKTSRLVSGSNFTQFTVKNN